MGPCAQTGTHQQLLVLGCQLCNCHLMLCCAQHCWKGAIKGRAWLSMPPPLRMWTMQCLLPGSKTSWCVAGCLFSACHMMWFAVCIVLQVP
jgi:hypothetical protein